MNIGGNLSKITSELLKQSKDAEKITNLFQKELSKIDVPPATMKTIQKLAKAQTAAINGMAKGLDTAEKGAKEVLDHIAKSDGGSEMQMLKELEKSINAQGEIVKKLIKNASR